MLQPRALLAVAVVTDVAVLARGRPVAAKALAERQGRAPRHLESLLQTLVRGGVLKGTRGPKGGYALARERRRISVGDIVRTVEAEAAETTTPALQGLIETVIVPALADAGRVFLSKLDDVTVEHLCRLAQRSGSAGKGAVASEFHI